VVKTNSVAAASDPPSSGSNFLTEMFNQLVQLFQNPAQTLNAIIADPSAWFPLLFFVAYQAFFEPVGWTTWSLVLSSPAWLAIALVAGINAFLAQLGPADIPVAAAPGGVAGAAVRSAPLPAVAFTSTGGASGLSTGSTPAGGGVSGATTPAPAAGFGYVVGGIGPDDGPGPTLIDREGTEAPGRAIPAAVALGAVDRDKARVRRRRRAEMRDYGDEFADMNIDVNPDWGVPTNGTEASDRGAGSLGFVGTVRKDSAAEAAGLATLSGNGFGGGPSMPMVPGTWGPDAPEGKGGHG
jgi:PPE-repeat protein